MSAEVSSNLEAGIELLEIPEWVKLLRHFELGEGFAFIILLVSNRSVARRCQSELDLWLRARQRPALFVLPLKTAGDLSNVPEQLLALAPPEGPIWVDGTGAREVYEEAWKRCALKLNRARDAIATRFAAPVLFVGAPWIREILRDTAPDFWSVRAFSAEISIKTRVALPDRPMGDGHFSDFALNPDLALRAIAELRGKPGRERQLSGFLDRAGTEMFLSGRSQEALPLLREAMELDEAAVSLEPERADYRRDLAVSYDRMGDLQRAAGEGEAVREFYEKSLKIRERLVAEEPGRADYLRDLSVSYNKMGDLEGGLGEGEAARQFYGKLLQIAERLVAQEPGRADYQVDLVESLLRVGGRDHLQRALDILLDLKRTHRLNKSEESMIEIAQQRLQLAE